jgi:hypothetical protein
MYLYMCVCTFLCVYTQFFAVETAGLFACRYENVLMYVCICLCVYTQYLQLNPPDILFLQV